MPKEWSRNILEGSTKFLKLLQDQISHAMKLSERLGDWAEETTIHRKLFDLDFIYWYDD